MPLPFKSSEFILLNDKILAPHRLKYLKRHLKRDLKYRNEYTTFMRDLLDKGYAEKVPESELLGKDGCINYIPNHGVYHPKSQIKLESFSTAVRNI